MPKRYDPFATKRRPGAPSIYTPELAAEICRRIKSGRGLYSICDEDADMPHLSTVYDWLHAHDDFAEMYARAKVLSADADAEKAERIADAVAQGKLDPNAGRVAIDGIKWTTAHKQPKRFGVQRHEHGGADGGAIPLRFESLSDAQLAQFISRIDASAVERAAAAESAGGGGTGAPPEGEDQ
jgi:hypothetical protein